MNDGDLDAIEIEAGILDRLLPAHEAVSQAVIQAPIVLPINVAIGREPTDLTAESGGELGRVETIDRLHAALAGEEAVVVDVDVVAEDGDEAHSSDDDSLLRISLPPNGGDEERRMVAASCGGVRTRRSGSERGLFCEKRQGFHGGEAEGRRGGKGLHRLDQIRPDQIQIDGVSSSSIFELFVGF